jgi:hypothetical protein
LWFFFLHLRFFRSCLCSWIVILSHIYGFSDVVCVAGLWFYLTLLFFWCCLCSWIGISSTLLPSYILFCSIVGYELNKNFDICIVFEWTFWIIFIVYSDQLSASQCYCQFNRNRYEHTIKTSTDSTQLHTFTDWTAYDHMVRTEVRSVTAWLPSKWIKQYISLVVDHYTKDKQNQLTLLIELIEIIHLDGSHAVTDLASVLTIWSYAVKSVKVRSCVESVDVLIVCSYLLAGIYNKNNSKSPLENNTNIKVLV